MKMNPNQVMTQLVREVMSCHYPEKCAYLDMLILQLSTQNRCHRPRSDTRANTRVRTDNGLLALGTSTPACSALTLEESVEWVADASSICSDTLSRSTDLPCTHPLSRIDELLIAIEKQWSSQSTLSIAAIILFTTINNNNNIDQH